MKHVPRTLAFLALTAPAFTQTWTSSHPAQPGWTIRYAATVAEQAGDNQIFQFGGTNGTSSMNLAWRFHRTYGWTVLGNMPSGRHDAVATTVEVGGQDFVHLMGGGVGATSATTTNWRYDPATDSWDTSTYAPMPVAKTGMEAVTAPNGLVYVFGGRNASGSVTYDSMHIYDPVADTWLAGPTMPRARREFAAIKDCDGYIYLYGGSDSPTPHAEVDCFDTVSNVWLTINPHTGTAFADMLTPRFDVAGALGRDGRHYLMGGNVASPVAVPTVESYDPYTNTWSVEASMLESRNQHRVVGLGSRVWALGGYRKIWPTTKQLDSLGPLSYYAPCANDVAPGPPPIISHTFADAVAVEFTTSITDVVIDPVHEHFFTCQLAPNVKTFFDVQTGAAPNGLQIRMYDQNRALIFEGPARDGLLIDSANLQGQFVYVTVANVSGIGSSAYDLAVSSSNEPQAIGQVYCTAAVPNSTGDPSGIRAEGLASAAANSIRLTVASLPRQSYGYFLVAPEAGLIVNPGGSTGNLCLTGFSIGRYAGNILNSGQDGQVVLDIDTTNIPGNPPSVGQPGDTWYFTYWHRDADPVAGLTSNFSDGVCIELR